MISKIEKIRIQKKVSKAKLAREAEISLSMYYRYIKSNDAPHSVVDRLIKVLGCVLIVVIEVPE